MKKILKTATDYILEHESFFILVFSFLISITASAYFFSTDKILLYNDARSHMDIARRVTDSLTPGVMQIGSVWLPLYQIFMLPFIQNDFLWRTGLAGTIVSSLAYIAASYFIYKTLKLITKSTLITLLGFLIFSLNPNLLYLQSAPLDEVLAVSAASASLYFILVWSKTESLPDLIFAAFFAFLGSLTRYEIWFLLFAEAFFVVITCLKNADSGSKFRKAEGIGILFSFMAFSGIILWLVYNFLGWGDPLYFLHNPSAHIAQQREFEHNGLLPTKHNLTLSAYVLFTNIIENIGAALTGALSISLLYLLLIRNNLKDKIYYLSSLAPLGFLLITLYFGVTVLFTKMFPSPGTTDKIFNVRYGVIALIPAVILVAAALAEFNKKIKKPFVIFILMMLIIFADIFFFYKTGTIATIQDGETGISAFGQANEVVMSKIVRENCANEKVLISAGQDEIIMFESGFPMKQFIYEGSGDYWTNALANPEKNVNCIVIEKNGFVDKGLAQNPNWKNNYIEIFNSENNSVIYKKKILQ